MNNNLTWKIGVIVATTLICLYGIFGLPKSQKELVDNFNQNIKLGLDLKGGSQLVVQVQLQDAFKAEADSEIERLRLQLSQKGVTFGLIDRTDPQTLAAADSVEITVNSVDPNKIGDFRAVAAENPNWTVTSLPNNSFKLTMKPTSALELKGRTVERARTTIENRINTMGIAENTVQQRGRSDADAELLIQLPGVDDPARVKQLIATAAPLELKLVKDGPFQSEAEARQQIPMMQAASVDPVPDTAGQSWWLLERVPAVAGKDIKSATPRQNMTSGQWDTDFRLSQEAARKFEKITELNVGKRLAIVMDRKVHSAPEIKSKIGDSGVIENLGSQQAATDLGKILEGGALPAGVQYLEERSVGPSLGADSIRQGLMSGLVGLAAVLVVMLFYYKRSGINAAIALILNAVILVGCLAYFGAVLTLPGIAGIVLLIGMAVDSNVLIFERIREELHGGKGVVAAIEAGFSKAFLTIIDTHVTTVVSCAFLFYFGTTQVKGFAVSLVIGLIANVFTSVFVSKVIFDWQTQGKRVEKLSI